MGHYLAFPSLIIMLGILMTSEIEPSCSRRLQKSSASFKIPILHSRSGCYCWYVVGSWKFHTLPLSFLSYQQILTILLSGMCPENATTSHQLHCCHLFYKATRLILFVQYLDHAIPLFNMSSVFLSHEIEIEVLNLAICPCHM